MSDEELVRRAEYAMAHAVLPEVKDRVMRSSTFKAIAALEDAPPSEWEEGLLEEVIEDVIAVDRVRWMERGWWAASLAVGITGAFLLGWVMRPVPEPEPVQWDCTVKVGTLDEVECKGMQ
jgi:hypothetical protein